MLALNEKFKQFSLCWKKKSITNLFQFDAHSRILKNEENELTAVRNIFRKPWQKMKTIISKGKLCNPTMKETMILNEELLL